MIVGIDPGLVTGWAQIADEAVWGTRDFRRSDAPLLELHHALRMLLADADLVCYEEPVARGHAARSLNRQLGVIILTCELLSTPHYPVNPGTLKKHATGRGNADKDEMLEAAALRGWRVNDHNACDALWLADYGQRVVMPTMENK